MANLPSVPLTKNDSLPSLQFTIGRTGSGTTAPDLASATVTLKIRNTSGTTNFFTKAVTSSGGTPGAITNTSAAIVRFDWSTDNWSSTGTFIGEISITSSGKVETAPDRISFVVSAEF